MPFFITVRLLNGQQIGFQVNPTDTILDVKKMIERHSPELRFICQILYYDSRPLQNDKTLSELYLSEGDELMVVMDYSTICTPSDRHLLEVGEQSRYDGWLANLLRVEEGKEYAFQLMTRNPTTASLNGLKISDHFLNDILIDKRTDSGRVDKSIRDSIEVIKINDSRYIHRMKHNIVSRDIIRGKVQEVYGHKMGGQYVLKIVLEQPITVYLNDPEYEERLQYILNHSHTVTFAVRNIVECEEVQARTRIQHVSQRMQGTKLKRYIRRSIKKELKRMLH